MPEKRPHFMVATVFLAVLYLVAPLHTCCSLEDGGGEELGGGLLYKWVESRTLYGPAVASGPNGYHGVMIRITVAIAYPGSGHVFIQTEPLTEIDTQATARMAALVASQLAGYNFFDYDFYVIMESSSVVVGGPSAGALMTIGFLSLMLNNTIAHNVTMTGMISPDGTIGPVGGLKEKLEAAASSGFRIFIIPYGQRIALVPRIETRRYPWGYVREVKYSRLDLVRYGEKLGVRVIEAISIRDAYYYFTGANISRRTSQLNTALASRVAEAAKIIYDSVMDNVSAIVDLTERVIRRVDPFYRGALYSLLNRVKQEAGMCRALSRNYTVLALSRAYDVYGDALLLYWTAMVIYNRSSINELAAEAGRAIACARGFFNGVCQGGVCPPCILSLSIAAAPLFSSAYMHYKEGVNALSSNNITLAVYDLSSSIAEVARVMAWSRLLPLCSASGGRGVELGTVRSVALLLYGVAEDTVSYAYSLARDLGSMPSGLAQAMSMLDMAREFASMGNESVTALGDAVNSITLSIESIHRMFSSESSTSKKLASEIRLEAMDMIACAENLSIDPMVPLYYIVYGDELSACGDYLGAIRAYIMASLQARALVLCYTINNTVSQELPVEQAAASGSRGASGEDITVVASVTTAVLVSALAIELFLWRKGMVGGAGVSA